MTQWYLKYTIYTKVEIKMFIYIIISNANIIFLSRFYTTRSKASMVETFLKKINEKSSKMTDFSTKSNT